MGKYNLGKSNASVNIHITKDNLFIDEKRCNELINNMVNKYLTYSEDIRANYEIINENLIIVS